MISGMNVKFAADALLLAEFAEKQARVSYDRCLFNPLSGDDVQ